MKLVYAALYTVTCISIGVAVAINMEAGRVLVVVAGAIQHALMH